MSDLMAPKNDPTKECGRSLHRKRTTPDLIVAFSKISGVSVKMDPASSNTIISPEVGRSLQNNSLAALPRLPVLSPLDTVKYLQQEMVKMKQKHRLEVFSMKLALQKVRESWEQEKKRILVDFWRQADIEKQKAITEIKKKQWCGHCGKEAIFYCCWNTSS